MALEALEPDLSPQLRMDASSTRFLDAPKYGTLNIHHAAAAVSRRR